MAGGGWVAVYRLNVRELQRFGVLEPGRRTEWHWREDRRRCGAVNLAMGLDALSLRYELAGKLHNYAVGIGHQPDGWRCFLCPVAGCGCACEVLHLRADGRFACARCAAIADAAEQKRPLSPTWHHKRLPPGVTRRQAGAMLREATVATALRYGMPLERVAMLRLRLDD